MYKGFVMKQLFFLLLFVFLTACSVQGGKTGAVYKTQGESIFRSGIRLGF